jgi:hypothetical protein
MSVLAARKSCAIREDLTPRNGGLGLVKSRSRPGEDAHRRRRNDVVHCPRDLLELLGSYMHDGLRCCDLDAAQDGHISSHCAR